MSEDKEPIYRICFKREQQLLSNAASNHKRNLLIFSTMSLGLILLSHYEKIYYLNSIFGINVSGSIRIKTICIGLFFLTLYEFIQFIIHYRISIKAFTESIKIQVPDITLGIEHNITHHLDKVYTLINDTIPKGNELKIETLKLYFNNEITYGNNILDKFTHFNAEAKSLSDITVKLIDKLNSSTSDTSDFKLDELYILTERTNYVSNCLLDGKSYLKNLQVNLENNLRSSALPNPSDLNEFNSNLLELNEKTKKLIECVELLKTEIIDKSCSANDLKLIDAYFPIGVGIISILTTLYYIFLW